MPQMVQSVHLGKAVPQQASHKTGEFYQEECPQMTMPAKVRAASQGKGARPVCKASLKSGAEQPSTRPCEAGGCQYELACRTDQPCRGQG